MPCLVNVAVLAHLCWTGVCVAGQRCALEAVALGASRLLYPKANSLRRLVQAIIGQLVVVRRGHVEVKVDAVQRGSRDTLVMGAHHNEGAGALPGGERVAWELET